MMDALSDILRSMRFNSSVYFKKDFPSQWGMQINKSNFAQFHMVVRGNCWLQIDGDENPRMLTGGDIVLFPHGKSHWLADTLDSEKVDGKKIVEAHYDNEEIFNGKKTATSLVCGHFEFDKEFNHPFIKSLPEFIQISEKEAESISWIENATKVIIAEAVSKQPGSEIVTLRLAEILFIQIIRSYILQNKNISGFLSALTDNQISSALKIIHSRSEDNFTLEEIAREVGMSRASFANKFKTLVGLTPMNYATNWRMNKAKDLLRNKNLSTLDIAEKVGYSSEASFSRAFKKQFNSNPGMIRRQIFATTN